MKTIKQICNVSSLKSFSKSCLETLPSNNQLQIRKRLLYILEKVKARLSLLSGKHESI